MSNELILAISGNDIFSGGGPNSSTLSRMFLFPQLNSASCQMLKWQTWPWTT